MLPYILNIKYQVSLWFRCTLTLVSNICEEALISLFQALGFHGNDRFQYCVVTVILK